jgi:hypothetical protein
MNIKDNELRGIILRKYYERRRETRFQWKESDLQDIDNNIEFDSVDLFRICDQLAEYNLIEWKPIVMQGKTQGGLGQITAFGVDVIEQSQEPPISINLDQRQNITIQNSSNVNIGNVNIQELIISKFIEEIDNSKASDTEKKEAKSLLQKFLEHPLIVSVFGGLASTIR